MIYFLFKSKKIKIKKGNNEVKPIIIISLAWNEIYNEH